VPALPETPTIAELELQTYPTYSWWGVYAPAGTPRPIVERMSAALVKAVRAPDVTAKFV
jgi:tripartite-type tricarboxylate transporter receptor subunit TctC